jgi:hypothetical protein
MVPQSMDSQPIAWAEIGVQETNVPAHLLPAQVDIAKHRQLEITSDAFQVAVRLHSAPQPAPRIRLADIAVAANERGGQLIATRLILASDGLPECTLRLPTDQELVSVALDGRPALVTALNGGGWRLALGSAQLPQSLEILSRLPGAESSVAIHEVRRPNLLAGDKAFPVEVSLWIFSGPGQAAGIGIEGAAPVGAIDQTALRFDRLVSIAESATNAATQAPKPDGENWFRPWAAMLREVQQQTRQSVNHPAADPAKAQVSSPSDEQIISASKRLDAWLLETGRLVVNADGRPLKSLPAPSPWNTTRPLVKTVDALCYVSEGGGDRLVLTLAPEMATASQLRLLGLLAVAVITGVCAWMIHAPLAGDFLCRWPFAIGVLLGIIYWGWLWPSWFGLLIVVASVWLALRFDWPGRSLPAEASTVLRSTRSQ